MRFRGVSVASLAAALGLTACGARSELYTGVAGRSTLDGSLSADAGVSPSRLDCAEAGVTYVYTFGTDNNLYSFYPATAEFTLVGPISCPTTDTPFSMAVDHQGVAYVEFTPSGDLFRVSTKTAECEPTAFHSGQQGFTTTFGMGFVANGADGGGMETLFLGGDPAGVGATASPLAEVDTTTFKLTNLGLIGQAGSNLPVYQPELTGTGGGKLYAFFAPDNAAPPSYIAEINTQTLAVESTVVLPGVVEGGGWAFGFWGGDFYVFTEPDAAFGDGTSVVTRYRPSDGTIAQVAIAPQGVGMVGAGVSTCAPLQ